MFPLNLREVVTAALLSLKQSHKEAICVVWGRASSETVGPCVC